jgi:GT2 family glycosyltransferase
MVIATLPNRPQNAPHMSMTPTSEATVVVALIANTTGGYQATVDAVDAQVYALRDVVVVGADEERIAALGPDVVVASTLTALVDGLDRTVDFVWVLHEGAVPAPDALLMLVTDADRIGAGIIGSKILGAGRDDLVSIGLITDVYNVPYTGLDQAERDQGQYDIVREVAAVSGVSALIRRDLFIGIGGADELMTPIASAIDLGQRARLRGAIVAITAASEVVYEYEMVDLPRWKAEASRTRSVMKIYGSVTLLWVLPLDFLSGLVEWIVSLFFGKWYAFDWVRSWAWNVWHLPSTIKDRHVARSGNVIGDAGLFAFQRSGSIRFHVMVKRSAAGMRRRLPGDDRLTLESLGRDVRQPAFVIGILAVIFVLLAARNLWSDGFPAVGYTLPFPSNGWDVLNAYAGGWNPAGFGSTDPLRPLLGIAGVAKIVTLSSPTLGEYILGAGALLVGIWGMTRLLRTWSIPPAAALLAGIVFVAGPGAQAIGANTHIGTLLAIGVLPWALRVALAPLVDSGWAMVARIAGATLVFGVLGALSPLMLGVPVVLVGVYALFLFRDRDAWRGFIVALAGTAGGVLLLSPWIWSVGLLGIARSGYAYWIASPVVTVAGAVVAIAAILGARKRLGYVAAWAALMAGAGFFLSRAGSFGLGTEAESVALAVMSLGIGILVGIVATVLSSYETRRAERLIVGIGAVGIVILLVASATIVLGGRIGLPGDRFVNDLAFTAAEPGVAERSRVLMVGPAELLPGDSRTIKNGAYRVVSAPYPDLGEARLAEPLAFDRYLESKLDLITSGETKRAGDELAVFGIKWIVVVGDSTSDQPDESSAAWRQVFAGQLDLLPLNAATSNAVFVVDVEPVGRALTSSLDSWARVGWQYEGEPEVGSRVFVTENPSGGWGPPPWQITEFSNEVAGDLGVATYTPDSGLRIQAIGVVLAIIVLIGLVAVGRKRS